MPELPDIPSMTKQYQIAQDSMCNKVKKDLDKQLSMLRNFKKQVGPLFSELSDLGDSFSPNLDLDDKLSELKEKAGDYIPDLGMLDDFLDGGEEVFGNFQQGIADFLEDCLYMAQSAEFLRSLNINPFTYLKDLKKYGQDVLDTIITHVSTVTICNNTIDNDPPDADFSKCHTQFLFDDENCPILDENGEQQFAYWCPNSKNPMMGEQVKCTVCGTYDVTTQPLLDYLRDEVSAAFKETKDKFMAGFKDFVDMDAIKDAISDAIKIDFPDILPELDFAKYLGKLSSMVDKLGLDRILGVIDWINQCNPCGELVTDDIRAEIDDILNTTYITEDGEIQWDKIAELVPEENLPPGMTREDVASNLTKTTTVMNVIQRNAENQIKAASGHKIDLDFAFELFEDDEEPEDEPPTQTDNEIVIV